MVAPSKGFVYFLMGGMLLTGTANTLILKMQNFIPTEYNGTHYDDWNHPFFQALIMFIGESCCMVVFLINRAKEIRANNGDISTSPAMREAEAQGLKTNINPLLIAIPAMCDVLASTLMFIALTMVDASVYQMMRGMIVFITALFSIIFLKRTLYRHHYTALGFIVGGIALVGVANVLQ